MEGGLRLSHDAHLRLVSSCHWFQKAISWIRFAEIPNFHTDKQGTWRGSRRTLGGKSAAGLPSGDDGGGWMWCLAQYLLIAAVESPYVCLNLCFSAAPPQFEASPYSISDGVLFADIPACRLECVSSPAASGLAARSPFPDFPQILLLHRRKI